jgi:putative hemolysin
MTLTQLLRPVQLAGPYRLNFAQSDADVARAQELRYAVFNQEMGSGLVESAACQRDEDAFDAVCEHLLVWDQRSNQVVGMLSRGIATYAQAQGARYLIGCSSLTSQDPAMDRDFKSIDFLTLMDLQSEGMRMRRKRFGISS